MLNSPQAPVKSRFQIAWPGSLAQRRMQHAQRPPAAAASQRATVEPRLLMLRAAARPACAGRAAPRYMSSGPTQRPMRVDRVLAARWPGRLVGRDRAEHQVGMAADIFGAGLDREIDALLQRAGNRAASPRCCPSAPARPCACATAAIAGMSCISKVSEPGASVNTARVFGLQQRGDAGADQRIVVGRLDAEALEHGVAEIAGRADRRCR